MRPIIPTVLGHWRYSIGNTLGNGAVIDSIQCGGIGASPYQVQFQGRGKDDGGGLEYGNYQKLVRTFS
jgi:hypothetical protein